MKNKLSLIAHAGISAFVIYFCMYAFRKPFAAATFEGDVFGMDFKVLLVISQVIGYALSKFIGIRFNSGVGLKNKAWYIILFILLAELALLGFAIVPKEYKFIFLFLNGLPLGMIWGLVFAYIEGRTITEILAAILSASFIMASGYTKAVGKWLMNEHQITEYWMPFTTGALFFIPLLIGVWAMEKVPPPTEADKANRKERLPMTNEDRKRLFNGLAPGLIALMLILFLMTAFRDLRDNFAAEFWDKLGYGDSASVFAITEFYISLVVLLLLGLFILIKDNLKALTVIQIVMALGMLLMLGSTILYQYTSFNSPLVWMTLSGLGVYMAYVTLGGSIIFERIQATFEYKGNVGFIIYLADAVGYLGSVIFLIIKEVFYKEVSFFDYFIQMIYVLGFVGLACVVFSIIYFRNRSKLPS